MKYTFTSKTFTHQCYCFHYACQVILLLLLIASCTPLQQIQLIPSKGDRIQAEGERLFINGNFQNALLHFEHIYETSLSAHQKNMALYGIACSQIILAEKDEQLAEGIHNLVRWDAAKGSAAFSENHHLLVLALSHQGERLLQQQQRLEKNWQRQARQINQQKKMISKLGETMVNLQNQLKELEALDEHYQEQKRNR